MNGKGKFDKLLEPGQIGHMKTKNRMIKTAAALCYRDEDGYVSERMKSS